MHSARAEKILRYLRENQERDVSAQELKDGTGMSTSELGSTIRHLFLKKDCPPELKRRRHGWYAWEETLDQEEERYIAIALDNEKGGDDAP